MNRLYAHIADAIVVFHLVYILFAVGGEIAVLLGGILRWRWIRNLTFRLVHLAAVVVVAIEALVGVVCPLTAWEYQLRLHADQRIEQQIPFMVRLVHRIIFYDFPAWVFTVTYVLFSVLVVASLVFLPPRRKARSE